MTTYHVQVTAEDIAKGARRAGMRCPVALALKREVAKTDEMVVVCADEVLVGDRELKTSSDTETRIRNYDAGADMAPFTAMLYGV